MIYLTAAVAMLLFMRVRLEAERKERDEA